MQFLARLANRINVLFASHSAIAATLLAILVWFVAGAIVGFGLGWMQVAWTVSAVVTVAMVVLIEHHQRRLARATQLKLNEIIRCLEGSDNRLVAIEEAADEELDEVDRAIREQVSG